MEQQFFPKNRWLYRVLRILAGVMTSILAFATIITVIAAFVGHTELLSDLLDLNEDMPALSTTAKILLVVASCHAVFTYWLLFRSINRFMKHAESGDLFLESAARALSRMGTAMICLYIVFLLFDILLPAVIEPDAITENGVDYLVYLVDGNMLTLLIGVVLLALSKTLREGHELRSELTQIV